MIIIIGGGITGLAAAHELSRRDQPFVLLEDSPRPGGLILTEQSGGFTIDAGPDSILSQKPAGLQLCDELGLGDRLMTPRQPRTAFVLKDGRLHRLPTPSVLGIPTSVTAALRYDLLPLAARARLALEPAVPRQSTCEESVGSFFRRRFGRATVGLIAEPLLGGIHAGDVENLSVGALFPRLVEAESRPGKVIRSLKRQPPVNRDGLFRALRGGMGELVAALVSRLPPSALCLESPALGLRPTHAAWQVETAAASHVADAVVFAAPAHAAASCLRPLDPEAARMCDGVPYASTACVALGFRRSQIRHPLHGSGFVVARRYNRLRVTACTWVSSKWESRAPDDHALIRAFAGGVHDPGVVDLTDEALVDTAIRDLSPILDVRDGPMLSRVYRWRNAGAQHTVGHRNRMQVLDARLKHWPGLFVTGSGFDSIGIPDCIANGRRAAAAAADYVRMRR